MLFCVSKTPSCAARTSRPGLSAINIPALVSGREDVLAPPDLSVEIAGLIPGAELVLVEDCGHLSTMEVRRNQRGIAKMDDPLRPILSRRLRP